MPLVEQDGAPVSSSRIRELVAAGDVVAAADLLGAPTGSRARSCPGDARGRELGMPTVNLRPAGGMS